MTGRVGILTLGLDSRAGGVERFAEDLARALAPDNDVKRLGVSGVVPRNVGRVGLKDIWQSKHATSQLDSDLDLVVSNGTIGWGAPTGVPRIHVLHGTSLVSAWRNKGLPRRERVRSGLGGALAERLAAHGVVVVAVSQSVAEEARRLYRFDVHAVIQNGVDTNVYRPRDRAIARERLGQHAEDRIALFVGRAEPRKGWAVALSAARAAGYRLAVAGTRPVEGADYLGLLGREQLSWAYAAADCVVMPTSYEACSYVVLEALASGVPLVTTPVGWARDLASRVPAYRPFLVEPRHDAVVGALRTLAQGEHDEAVSGALELVRTQNSLEAFGRSWREQCVAVLP